MLRARRFRGPVIAAITMTAVIVAGVVVTSTVAQAASTWRQVDAGTVHTCGIQTDGSLWCWGGNWGGQLGLGHVTDRSSPARVGTRTDWHKVSVGGNRSCALTTSREIYCWGFQPNDDPTLEPRRRGTITTAPQRGREPRVDDVSASWGHTCAIAAGTIAAPKGLLYCWGDNESGQLGTEQSRVWGTRWAMVEVGPNHACGVRTDQRLYCWGGNGRYQLGLGDTSARYRPTLV